jgi:hypothetical protein
MKKTAVIILSDPKSGSDEALGRIFNALVTAYDAKQRGHEITVQFQGTGTRWSGLITSPDHPVNGLYEAVKDKIAGVSCGCADVFGAREAAEENDFKLIAELAVPGTSGLPSIARLLSEGYNVVTF